MHALNSLCFRWLRFVPVTHKRRTVHPWKKKKKKNESGLWKTSQAGSECTACFQRKVRMNSALLTRCRHAVRIKLHNADVDDDSNFYQFVLYICNLFFLKMCPKFMITLYVWTWFRQIKNKFALEAVTNRVKNHLKWLKIKCRSSGL